MNKFLICITLLLALTACGPKLSGKYTNDINNGNKLTADFHSDGTVTMNIMGKNAGDWRYQLTGRTIEIRSVFGKETWELMDNGTIESPTGVWKPAN